MSGRPQGAKASSIFADSYLYFYERTDLTNDCFYTDTSMTLWYNICSIVLYITCT